MSGVTRWNPERHELAEKIRTGRLNMLEMARAAHEMRAWALELEAELAERERYYELEFRSVGERS